MIWTIFPYFALVALLLWGAGAYFAWKDNDKLSIRLSAAGAVVFFVYILTMWIVLKRPPMRTMGETRLWYIMFISMAGTFIYYRWKYNWILTFSLVMELVFICINLLKPEIQTKNIMPALQSPFFAPHVIAYMFAYALFGASALMAAYLLWFKTTEIRRRDMNVCDDLVGVGLAFMTIGMLLGAFWAEQAWGHYWSWDPKETWAAATWFSYLTYLHLRHNSKTENEDKVKAGLYILLFSFLFLQICWFGVNYLPSARGTSMHIY